MVGSDFTAFRGDEEESVALFPFDFDICFITGLSIVNIAFIFQVKVMTVVGSGLAIIKNSLIGSRDREYISEDEGSFSCRYTHGDVEGEGKAKGVKGVTDFKDGGMFLRGRMD